MWRPDTSLNWTWCVGKWLLGNGNFDLYERNEQQIHAVEFAPLRKCILIIDKLQFNSGKRNTFFYTCLIILLYCILQNYCNFRFCGFISSSSLVLVLVVVYYFKIFDLFVITKKFISISILFWFLCTFGWTVSYTFPHCRHFFGLLIARAGTIL